MVTGAGSGIGEATTALLAMEGAFVVAADLGFPNRPTGAGDGGGGEPVIRLIHDVTSESSWDRCLQAVLGRWKRLDLLVNCAGISAGTPVVETALDEWRRVMAVNLDGAFLGTRAALRAMRGAEGTIVNVASLAGLEVFPGAAAYASSKAALIHFTKVVAAECAQAGERIRVMGIAPGGVRTSMWATMPFWKELAKEGEQEAWRRLDPTGSFYAPAEVAASIVGMVTDPSPGLNGRVVVLNRSLAP